MNEVEDMSLKMDRVSGELAGFEFKVTNQEPGPLKKEINCPLYLNLSEVCAVIEKR